MANSWENKGPNQYDFAIDGIPFLSAASEKYPYIRESIEVNKQQIDTAQNVGEQSLGNWWYRSQSSFDLGANVTYTDTAGKANANVSRRFFDSHGIDALETIGEVVLQNATNKKVTTTNTNIKSINYSAGGTNGILYTDGSALKYYNTTTQTTPAVVNYGATETILDIASDGSRYFVLTTAGLYAGALGSWTNYKICTVSADSGVLEFIKERLIFAIRKDKESWIYQVAPAVTSTPDELYKTVADFWEWSGIADGPQGIYFSGYSGENSMILFSTVQKTDASAVPEIQPPYTVATLPKGEVVYDILSYLSVYLVMGTNYGFRVAIIDSRGSLILGPVTKTDTNVKTLFAAGDFLYAGGANSVDSANNQSVAIYKINLAKTIEENTLQFAYQKFLFASETFAITKTASSISRISSTNKFVFTIPGVGLIEETDNKVSSGWIETGKIRLDTAEDKIFQYLKVTSLPVDGYISVYWRDETNALQTTPLGKWYGAPSTIPEAGVIISGSLTSGVKAVDLLGSDGEPHPLINYRFVLERGKTITNSPVLTSYTAKTNPANVKQNLIRIPLLALGRETPVKGLTIERSVFDRVKVLERAEQLGRVVILQDFRTGEERLCLIQQIQFISTINPETKLAGANRGGILLVSLRTVDPVNLVGNTIREE